MINIKKFELINAIESCLSNIFPDIHPIFIWLEPRVYIKYDQKILW